MRNDTPSYVVSEDGTGAFEYELDYYDLSARLEDARYDHEAGRLSSAAYIDLLRSATIEAPSWMDGYCELGRAFLEMDSLEEALESFLRAVNIGKAAFPARKRIKLSDDNGNNDAFLDACYSAVLCYRALGRFNAAIAMMERMMKWNPSDSRGVRHILGSEYLRNNMLAKAERIFIENADYPPYMYDMALLGIMQNDYLDAATWLRRAFLGNAYIAELPCGSHTPVSLVVFHETSDEELELAKSYVRDYRALWNGNPEAIYFLRWLHTHPKVMMERAAFFDCRQKLLWVEPGYESSLIWFKGEVIRENVDDRLSSDIVVKYRNWRTGHLIFPWREPVDRHAGP